MKTYRWVTSIFIRHTSGYGPVAVIRRIICSLVVATRAPPNMYLIDFYEMEKHVSNHRQAVEDLRDCSQHITVSVPDPSQRVEFLIDSISCGDPTLQAAIGLIRSNVNNMRSDFEAAANSLIEVDPFSRSRRTRGGRPSAQIAAIDFSAGRGKTGVDLRWHAPKEFKALSKDQKDELMVWQKTSEGQATLAKSKQERDKSNKRKGSPNAEKDKEVHNNRKKWLSNYVKKPSGLKHVMSVLAKEETDNSAFIATLQSMTPPPPVTTAPPVPPPPPHNVMQPSAPPQPDVGSANATAAMPSNSLAQSFPASATRVTLNSILKQPKKDGSRG